MGFGSFIGGLGLCVLSVLLGFFGLLTLLGFFNFLLAGYVVPLGIVMIVIALVLFLFGWYSYKSAKPQGTINVHNQ
jgi:protein-S-isoprenylcysteine O-methyltransferase Ste14